MEEKSKNQDSPKQNPKPKKKSKPKSQLGQVSRVDIFAEVENFYPLNREDLNFLQEYNKDLDIERALKDSGLKKSQLKPAKDRGQALLLEMKNIQAAHMAAIQMNAPAAARKHLELMQKFEDDYDATDLKSQNKSGLSSTLARMSDANLKATGHYGQAERSQGTKVEINIDLSGHNKKAEEIIEVKADE